MENQNKLEFDEQPLLYNDALHRMRKLEKQYGVTSDELFSALNRAEGTVEIDPDDLFEWRTYFDFVKEVEGRLECFLMEHSPLEEVIYATSSCVETPRRTIKDRRLRTLQIAA